MARVVMKLARRRGFTLVEVIVAVVVLTAIAAIMIPTFAGQNTKKAADQTASTLQSLSLSLNNANTALGNVGFLQKVKFYPKYLHHLTTQITRTDARCSGTAYVSADTAAWAGGAPYSGLSIDANGVATPLGWVHDTVFRSAFTPANSYIEVHLDSVSTADVQELDLDIDNSADSTSGYLRYGTATNTLTSQNLHLVRYLIVGPLATC